MRKPDHLRPTWQPISRLRLIAALIDETVANAEDQFETFTEVRAKPHVLDDATVARATRLYTTQVDEMWIYEGQLLHWLKQSLADDQRREAERLLDQLPRIKQLSEAILELLDAIKDSTIDKVLGKSDLELGLESLLRL